MQKMVQAVLNAVVVIIVVLWLLNVFGIISHLSSISVGK